MKLLHTTADTFRSLNKSLVSAIECASCAALEANVEHRDGAVRWLKTLKDCLRNAEVDAEAIIAAIELELNKEEDKEHG